MSATLDMAALALLDAQTMPAAISGMHGDDASRRFDVHRNTVATTLIAALSDATPVTRQVVGDAFFRAMAHARVQADPPRSPVLAEYADGFAGFIASYPPARTLPWLADLARLEAMRVQAWHAADANPLADDAYASLLADPGALQRASVRLHPAARWLRASHAVASVWDAHQQSDIDAALAAIDIDCAEDVLVSRPRLDVHVQTLPAGGAELLDALSAGATIGKAFAAACADDIGGDAATLFALVTGRGLVIALHERNLT